MSNNLTNKHTPEQTCLQVIGLTGAGMPAKTIAATLGVSRSVVSTVQKKFGVNPRPRTRPPLPESVAQQIRAELARGKNWQTVRRELSLPRGDVLAVVRDFLKSTRRKRKVIERRFARFQARCKHELGCDAEWLQKVLRDALGRSE